MSTSSGLLLKKLLIPVILLSIPLSGAALEKDQKKRGGRHHIEHVKCERYMCKKKHRRSEKDSTGKYTTIEYERKSGVNCYWPERDGWCRSTFPGRCRSITRTYKFFEGELLSITVEKQRSNRLRKKTRTTVYNYRNKERGKKYVTVEKRYFRNRTAPSKHRWLKNEDPGH